MDGDPPIGAVLSEVLHPRLYRGWLERQKGSLVGWSRSCTADPLVFYLLDVTDLGWAVGVSRILMYAKGTFMRFIGAVDVPEWARALMMEHNALGYNARIHAEEAMMMLDKAVAMAVEG